MNRTIRAACAAVALAVLAAPAHADGNAEAGKRVFNKCRACHVIDNTGRHKIGPNLMGLFGRKAGTSKGFNYSKAMRESNVVWNEQTLEKYLKDPRKFIPHNRMAFVGLRSEKEREDVIAYLKQATKPDKGD